MKLLVGLGNPGAKYARTRHNIGFMALDEIVRRHRFGAARDKFKGVIAEGEIEGERVLALKPMTFMNLSGESVAPAALFYKIPPHDVIVLHDELDLPPGKLKVKRAGGAAGHNGLRSIDTHLGNDYWRIRLGIGHPGSRELVLAYVLQNFPEDDWAWIETLSKNIAEAIPLMLAGKDSAFMSKVGGKPPPPQEQAK